MPTSRSISWIYIYSHKSSLFLTASILYERQFKLLTIAKNIIKLLNYVSYSTFTAKYVFDHIWVYKIFEYILD